MSLSTNVGNLATAVATNAKAMKVLINGNALDLSALTTVSKTNLVAAINEIAAAVGGAGAAIVDGSTSTASVWSSSKTNTSINTAVAALVATAPAALDTLNELAVALGSDPNFATTITTSLGLKAPAADPTFTGTVTGVTKAHVGLGSVDNTADAAKPVSTAQAAADGLRLLATDPSVTNARTPSNDAALAHLAGAETISGVKNFTAQPTGIVKASVGLSNVDNTTDVGKPISTAEAAALLLKANAASPAFTGTPTGLTKSHVGLANVDNTTDALKPISTAQASVNSAQATANGGFALGSDLGNAATDFVAAFNAGLV